MPKEDTRVLPLPKMWLSHHIKFIDVVTVLAFLLLFLSALGETLGIWPNK